MGPESNAGLFAEVGEAVQNHLSDEFKRRNLVASTLEEIDSLFEERDNTPNPVVEATLAARMYALSMVQRSRLGINGFSPLEALAYDGSVEAKAAPYHDEYNGDSDVFRTRVISFFSDGLSSDIKVFGLNLYCPGPEDDQVEDLPKTEAHSGLVVVDKRGTTKRKQRPVSGETVLFAAYHKQTKEAKYYQVNIISEDDSPIDRDHKRVKFISDSEAFVVLPDSQVVKVTLLSGNLQQQANAEFLASRDKLKGLGLVRDELSPQERQAVSSLT